MWVTEHPVLYRPCVLRTQQMESLNSLDFRSGELMDVFITALLSICPGIWRPL